MNFARSSLDLLDHAGRAPLRWLASGWRTLHFGALIAVLALAPSSYARDNRAALARHVYLDTAPILVGFTLLCALVSLVLTHIVLVTARSYGLSQYALEMVIRVLVLELIPLTAALFVALRSTIPNGAEIVRLQRDGRFDALRRSGRDPLRTEVLPRAVGGFFATLLLAALSCVVAMVLAYVVGHGFTLAGLPGYTRLFGQVFNPAVTLVFTLKTLLFALAVAVMPLAAGLHAGQAEGRRTSAELDGLVRLFAVLLLVEVAALLGNYY